MITFAVSMLEDIVSVAMPIAILFELTNLAVGTFMRMAFEGRIEFRR